jgi:hypothetical protein
MMTNCFTSLTGFDADFIGSLQVTARPDGWTKYQTRDDWIAAVLGYFSTKLAEPQQRGSRAYRALCFPMIKGATDYHWAIFNGTYWLEQAGRGGPLNMWANENDLLADVYKRGDDNTVRIWVDQELHQWLTHGCPSSPSYFST